MGVRPPPAKADFASDRYGNFLVYIRLHAVCTNAAYQILMLKMRWPVPLKSERKATPLFGSQLGKPFTHGQLDYVLPQLLGYVATRQPQLLCHEHLQRYSWHSFRIALACALRALTLTDGSKITDATIQAFCRWATPASLQAYARLNKTEYADLIDRATTCRFDSVQGSTLWDQSPFIDNDHRFGFMENLAERLANSKE